MSGPPAHGPDVNRRVTNRVQGAWAPHLPPWAMIVHHGRTSGREYRTPVIALRKDAMVTIALPYGSHTDWVRNVFAEGGCRMRRRGRTIELARPRVTGAGSEDSAAAEDRSELPRTMRLAAGRIGVLTMDVAAPPN